MPYNKSKDLPENIKDILPEHAENIYKESFNAALKEYGGDERRAYAVAWSAVKRQYYKNDKTGKWEKKV